MAKTTLQTVFMMCNAVLGAFFFGYTLVYLNPAMNSTEHFFDVDDDNTKFVEGLLNFLFPLGAGAGAFLSSQLLSMLSMRHSMMTTDIIGITGALIQIYFNINTLYLARFIIGFAVGLNSSIVPQYIKEFSPVQLSGSLGAMNPMSINIGIIVALSLGLGFSDKEYDAKYLRIVFTLPILVCLVRSLLLLTVYRDEPPKHYIKIGEQEKAEKVLNSIYESEQVAPLLQKMIHKQNDQETKYGDLFSGVLGRKVLVGCGLQILQQLSGINAIQFYSTQIFSTYYSSQKNILNIGVGLTNLIFSIACIPVLAKIGRRPLLFYGTILCSIVLSSMAVITYLFSHEYIDSPLFIVILIFAYLIFFQFSLGPVVWVYTADILPEKGVSLAVLSNWFTCAIIGLVFPTLADLGLDLCFIIFGGFCFVGIFFIHFLVVESKDRTMSKVTENFFMSMQVEDETKK